MAAPLKWSKFQCIWQEIFGLLRLTAHRTVFWMGGYAAKFGLAEVYDENMAVIRKWIQEAGFEMVTAFDKVDVER